MISKKDAQIISHLRNNARKRITDISKEIRIPVTTAYDRVKAHNKKFVKKHVTLLDFSKLGLNATANLAIKVEKDSRDNVRKFLMEHPNVNSLSRVNFGSDFLAEVIFKDIACVENFVENLENNYSINQIQIFNVIEELKKEEFLTEPEHFELV